MAYDAILIYVILALYSVAAVLYVWSVLGKSGTPGKGASLAMLSGFGVHTVTIAMMWITLRHLPFTNLYGSLLFAAWALVLQYLIIERKHTMTAIGIFVSLVAVGILVFASMLPKEVSRTLIPALQSHWGGAHILSMLLSYASFILAFAAAIGYLLQEHLLKTKQISTIQQHLPPLDSVDRLAYRMVAHGFPLLTIGIITGAVWAHEVWGTWWNWDPKQTWALITWLIYAAYLHVRIVSGWRGKWANRLLITGFVCVVITYIGLNYFAHGSSHTFRW